MTVYFIQQGDNGPIKIGYTKADIWRRCAELQCGNPIKLNILGSRPGTHKDEAALHRKHARDRMVGEWFYPTDAILNEAQDGRPYQWRQALAALGPIDTDRPSRVIRSVSRKVETP